MSASVLRKQLISCFRFSFRVLFLRVPLSEEGMDKQEVMAILASVGAFITDSHIVYTSRRHGTAYVNKDALSPHTEKTARICRAMAERCVGMGVEAVVSPALGGIILSQWIARHLSEMEEREVFGVYAEKDPERKGEFLFTRGYEKYVKGRRIVVAEDIVNSGASLRAAVRAARAAGGEVIAAVALLDRGGVSAGDLRVPSFRPLVSVAMESWSEEECPLCRKGVPVNTEVGKGREFLRKNR